MKYFYDVWSAISQLINAIFGGVPCETISGRAYRTDNKLKPVINAVFFWQNNHSRESHHSDIIDARWLIAVKDLSKPSQQSTTD